VANSPRGGGRSAPQGASFANNGGAPQGGLPQANGAQSAQQPGAQLNGQQPEQNGSGVQQHVSTEVIDAVITYLEKLVA
jgi:hypothetical protein